MGRRFLLELTVGGHVLRLTTDPDAVTVSGERYEPGLSAGPVDVAAMTASVSVSWSPPGGWGAWIGQTGPVDESPAVLLWHRDGETRDECAALAAGVLVDVAYGGQQDPLVGKIVASEGEVLMPPPTAAILQEDWTTSPESVIGRVPPIILGYPGSRADDGSSDLPAVPALYVSPGGTDYLAIAHGSIGATTCTLTRISGGVGVISKWTGAPVTEEQPGAHVVSVVSNLGSPAPSGFFVADGVYMLSFDSDTATHGGVVGGDGTVVRGAGKVLRWVLERYSAEGVDVGRWRQHEEWLDSYKIDTFVDQPIGGVDWIRRAILPWLPVRLRRSAAGWWLQPHRYQATAADVVRSLSADRGDVQRTSGVSTRAEVYNAFSASYRLGRSGRYYSVRNLEGLPGQLQRLPGGTDTRQYGRADLRLSELRFGRRVAPPLKCSITWDTSTAAQILHDAADEHGWPKRAVQYVGGVDLDYLEPGQVVQITDSEIAAYDVLALIERVTLDVEEVVLDLTLLDTPGAISVPPAASSVSSSLVTPSDVSGLFGWWDGYDSATYDSGTGALLGIKDKGPNSIDLTAPGGGPVATSYEVNGVARDLPGPFPITSPHPVSATGLGELIDDFSMLAIIPIASTRVTTSTYASLNLSGSPFYAFQLKQSATSGSIQAFGSSGSVDIDVGFDNGAATGAHAIVLVRRHAGQMVLDSWYDKLTGGGLVKPSRVVASDPITSGAFSLDRVAVGGRASSTYTWQGTTPIHAVLMWDRLLTDAEGLGVAQWAARRLGFTGVL